jgi:TATA-binding protein-associated factor
VNAAFSCCVSFQVTLRHYQQEGINWLAFLHRFGLHGVLADDMGLGKTLQATSIMACSLAEQAAARIKAEAAVRTGPGPPVTAAAALAAASGQGLLPSLVVCPSTLVAHWAHEIQKYIGPGVLSPLPILGTPAERAAAQKRLPKHQVAIISYEALRTDVEWAVSVAWDYVILDEGHVIRSTKSKVAQAVKKLVAQHRLILSGTPIQNNALELWSLFDFLMPGFLGSKLQGTV